MGGKNQQSADASGQELSKQSGSDAPKQQSDASSCAPKHWVGVRVEDEGGKPVKDVTVHVKLTDAEFDIDMAVAAVGRDGVFRTKKIFDSTTCEFSFPTLYDIDWWLKGGKAGDSATEQPATVAESECVLSVAERLGFREYHDIWDRGSNKALKDTRPNANMLVVGDTLQAPNDKAKLETKATDQAWTFVVRTKKPAKLRIVLTDKDGKPLKDKAWELIQLWKKGKTGANGLIEATPLRAKLTAETLKVHLRDARKAPKPAKKPSPPKDPAPYPPPVVVADFKDKMPDPDYSALAVEWQLAIGGLASFNVKNGVLARLHNLGFSCDSDSDDQAAADAVKAYQRVYQKNKNGSGVPADIQAELRDRHDKA